MPEYADIFPAVPQDELPFQTSEERRELLDAYRAEDDRQAEQAYVYPDPYPADG